MTKCLVLAMILAAPVASRAGTVTVATASNFAPTAEVIAERFEAASGHEVRLSIGSTGKLYAQIVNGAPFDVFLSADAGRPALLEANGLAVRGSRKTYATGALVLWSGDPAFADADCREALANLGKRRLAIANPVTAPYGAAAREFLQAEGLWEMLEPKLVVGENIGQALQFAATGNAAMALVARSQLEIAALPAATCNWPVPAESHAPIEQQAVLLVRAESNPAAVAFHAYLDEPQVRELIAAHGYAAD